MTLFQSALQAQTEVDWARSAASGPGDWTTGGNWSSGSQPGTNDVAVIKNGGTAVIDGVAIATHGKALVSAGGSGWTSGVDGSTLTIQNGGSLDTTANNAGWSQFFVGSSSGTATTTVTGTNSLLKSQDVYVAYSAHGVLNIQSGGTVIATRNVIVGQGTGGNGTVDLLSGGTLQVGTGFTVQSDAPYLFKFDGGTLQVNNASGMTTTLAATMVSSTTSAINTNGNSATFSGALTGAGTLNKTGSGTLTLSGASNTFGGMTVSAGTLALSGGNNRLSTSSAITATGGTLDLGGNSQTTSGNVVINGGTVINGTLTKSGGNFDAQSGSVSAVLAGSGSEGLNKTTSGTVTLTGVNTYTGTTSVTGGTLVVGSGGTGSLAGSASVSSSGTLGGSGSIAGNVSAGSGGTLSPGNSPGNLSVGSLTLTAGGNYNWQIVNATGAAGTGYDTITSSGAIDLTGLSTSSKYAINLWSLSSTGPDVNGDANNFNNVLTQSWVLASGSSVDVTGLTGSLSNYFQVYTAANNGANGFSNATDPGYAFSVGVSGNNLVLNYAAAVPEPSTCALVLMSAGAIALMTRARIRRGKNS